jgi:3'-phosphoadenosine 5'-phosphosulfate sulfotransferase (PAPS reductase)/FAD synthetase
MQQTRLFELPAPRSPPNRDFHPILTKDMTKEISSANPDFHPAILPNSTSTIFLGKKGSPVELLFYGNFRGEPFSVRHLQPRLIHRVLCVHDAKHSVALFLTQKDASDIAIHNYIPFSFPTTAAYTIEYTQKFNYPLLITRHLTPVETYLQINGVPKAMARWCTRTYKIEMPRGVYKHFNLQNITQIKGMTRFQSARRNKLDPSRTIDPMSQKTFQIYQELPIFDMTDQEQERIIETNGIAPNPYDLKYNLHGCLFCPFRNEKYYQKLANQDPELYQLCHYWRSEGSKRPQKDGSLRDYWYFPKSQIM